MSNGQQEIWGRFSPILERIVYIFSGIGILAYIIEYIISLAKHEQPIASPIDLAAVTATLGGLILVGAFYKNNTDLGQNLKTSAKYLLGSSVFFIISFFLLEGVLLITSPTLSWVEWFFVIFTDLSIIAAGYMLCFALGRLVRILPLL